MGTTSDTLRTTTGWFTDRDFTQWAGDVYYRIIRGDSTLPLATGAELPREEVLALKRAYESAYFQTLTGQTRV